MLFFTTQYYCFSISPIFSLTQLLPLYCLSSTFVLSHFPPTLHSCLSPLFRSSSRSVSRFRSHPFTPSAVPLSFSPSLLSLSLGFHLFLALPLSTLFSQTVLINNSSSLFLLPVCSQWAISLLCAGQ